MINTDIELNINIARCFFESVEKNNLKNEDIIKQGFPISFVYGGKPSSELLKYWSRKIEKTSLDENTDIITHKLTDSETGLEVEAKISVFKDTPGIDWTVYFRNNGTENTPVLENVRPLDIYMRAEKANSDNYEYRERIFSKDEKVRLKDYGLPMLKRIKGSVGCDHFSFNEFQSENIALRKSKKHVFGSKGETYMCSSYDYAPFFEVLGADGGVVTAIGWSGRWTACVEALEDGYVNISSGMTNIHTYLCPGETIRTPRIMQVYWKGDDPDKGYNLFRQAMLKHIVVKNDQSPIFPPLSYPCVKENLDANYENQIRHIETDMDGLGLEVYWLDAWWHKKGFPEGTGNYIFPIETSVDTERFPYGIEPVSKAAHEKGYMFLLWIAPEMAYNGTLLTKIHPEWMLCSKDEEKYRTVNLGIPEAREHLTKFINSCIKKWNIDIFRTDFGPYTKNIEANDTDENRHGILEVSYCEGLYKLWDDLRLLNPGLIIDNCCAGGTRIDLETCARAIPLWRTDSAVWTISIYKDYVRTPIINQIINASLNRYVPFSLSGSIGIEPYYMRSAFNGGLTFYDESPVYEKERKILRKAIAECKRLRRYLLGDFYSLIFQSHDPAEWIAYQYHLKNEDSGAVFIFRRDYSPYKSVELGFKAVGDETQYEVLFYESYDLTKSVIMKGKNLKDFAVEINSIPGSLLIEYKPV